MEIIIFTVVMLSILGVVAIAIRTESQNYDKKREVQHQESEAKWAELIKEPKYLVKFTVGKAEYSTEVWKHRKSMSYRLTFKHQSSREVAKARLISFYATGIFRASDGVTYPRHTITNTWIEKG